MAGIIIIQVNWFSNLLLVQEDKFKFKIEKAGMEVAADLSKQASSGVLLRLRRKPDLQIIPDDLSLGIARPPTISQRFTGSEIYDKLRKALNKEGLEDVNFEFAITTNSKDFIVEMQSKNFFNVYFDTLHTKQIGTPIVPESGTDMEGLFAYEHLFIAIPDFKTQVWKSLTWMILGAILFTLIIFAAFFLTVKTILNQRKLNKIKSDFINNMTHELKTPLATISLAVDALKNEKVQDSREKMQYFNSIIKEENRRMNGHVETILQAASMDRQELKLNLQPVHVHDIINRVLDNFHLQLKEKNAETELLLNAKNDAIDADEGHFTNLVSNLIDNAIKYSGENLVIKITTHSTAKHFLMQIQDNGIGMSKETTKRIFEKFYRAHTGNIHNVKGFGLGMNYVKTVLDAHKGKIKVESSLGKGSTFTIDLPLANVTADIW